MATYVGGAKQRSELDQQMARRNSSNSTIRQLKNILTHRNVFDQRYHQIVGEHLHFSKLRRLTESAIRQRNELQKANSIE